MGTRLDHSKIPGMREHASPFKYLGDALYLRNQLVRMLEEAEAESDPETRKRLLTFVVAGGGFSGVECIAEMNDFLREAVSAYHNIGERDPSARRPYLAGGHSIAGDLRAQASR
jgi:NADH:quinone reductase (non-electrogenic)